MKPGKWAFPLLLSGALFAAEPVSLDTGTGVLYGTLELPTVKAPYPVVLIIAGSGPTDRDGNSSLIPNQNNSLKMVAEALAARGIASLRYDKRAIGESKAAAARESDLRFEMYVNDAAKWGEYLRKDSRFGALVIAGHSEGSLIGMLAAQKLQANGYISIAGPGEGGGEIILKQLRPQLPADSMKLVEAAVKSLEDGHTVDPIPPGMEGLLRASVQPYLISWFRYDPAREIAKLKMPILILQGTTDIQIKVADANLLHDANPAAKLVVIEGMNHVLKLVPAVQKEQLASYGDPSLAVAPKLIDAMVDLAHQAGTR
ncbi:MAG TPA: alpha/beta hydrolase [Bryobacteraceae bacterium]|nr:alpha/beta hydrolase [Bryobacteraceae bacterium]